MLADEIQGRWRQAAPARPPSNAGSGRNRFSVLFSVACLARQSCVAVGSYQDASGNEQAMATTTALP
jgi:hypothetical protein